MGTRKSPENRNFVTELRSTQQCSLQVGPDITRDEITSYHSIADTLVTYTPDTAMYFRKLELACFLIFFGFLLFFEIRSRVVHNKVSQNKIYIVITIKTISAFTVYGPSIRQLNAQNTIKMSSFNE